jgi:hypothetical protein
LKKIIYFAFFSLCIANVFPQNQSDQILNNTNVENFIRNWENLHNDFINYFEENGHSDIYFGTINRFIFGLTDMTIFMLGYSDDALQNTVLQHINRFNEILNMSIPDEINEIFINNNLQNGHKIYFTLLIGAILIGIEKRAILEKDNPNNTMQIEPILRNTRAHFSIINEDDFKIINNYLSHLPQEINRYYYGIN